MRLLYTTLMGTLKYYNQNKASFLDTIVYDIFGSTSPLVHANGPSLWSKQTLGLSANRMVLVYSLHFV